MTRPLLPDAAVAIATTASAAASCTARLYGVEITVSLARDLTVAAGDALLLHKVGDRYYGCCRLFAAAGSDDTLPEDVPDPNTAVAAGVTLVMPVTTGTYRDGAWMESGDDTIQGSAGGYGLAAGVAHYGTKPSSLAGVTVLAASVRLSRTYGGVAAAAATTLWLVTETEQSGAPTLTSSTAGPSLLRGESVEAYPVPTAWAQAIADGTAGGLAVYDADGSPYARLSGRGTDPAAWALAIEWQR